MQLLKCKIILIIFQKRVSLGKTYPMKTMYSFLFAILIGGGLMAQDTFSIIAADPITGEIGSAGASCVTGVGSGGIIDIITDIIPGRGRCKFSGLGMYPKYESSKCDSTNGIGNESSRNY